MTFLQQRALRFKLLINKYIEIWKGLNKKDNLDDSISKEEIKIDRNAREAIDEDEDANDIEIYYKFALNNPKATKEEINDYFNNKLKIFVENIKEHFDIKKEFLNERFDNQLLSQISSESNNEIKFYESGMIEYTNKWGTRIKVKSKFKISYSLMD